jgi:hypothetical protein
MNKIILILVSSLFLSVFACNKVENIEEVTKVEQQEEVVTKSGDFEANSVKVNCKGDCDCGLEGVFSGSGGYIQCKCDKCAMTIEHTFAGTGQVYNSELADATIEVPYLKEFAEYMNNTHTGMDYSIKEIVLYNYEKDNPAINYYYELDNGEVDDVIFAKSDAGDN